MAEPNLRPGSEKAPQLEEVPPGIALPLTGLGAASLALGVLGVALFWAPLAGQALSILAVIFGYFGLRQVKNKTRRGAGVAAAGLILGVIGLAILISLLIIGTWVVP